MEAEMHGIKSFNDGEEEEIRCKAHGLCREFLNGAWLNVTANQFILKKVGGGLSNLLYYCSLPEGVNPIRDEPSRVLLRIYGPTHDGASVLEAHLSECIVFTMLSEKQSGPRLYGVFSGGRLEQFIPGRPLATDELLDDELSLMVAEAAAQIHKMSVPLSKEPNQMWNTLFRWMDEIEKYMRVTNNPDIRTVQLLTDVDLRCEVKWLRSYLKTFNSPVVFCHNDIQEGNILLTNTPKGKSIVLIDFEYCAYNHRAYDLANHFCETMYDYSNENHPYFWEKPNNFPSKEQQMKFAERYLCKFEKKDEVSDEEIEKLVNEVEAYVLASHLFWAVWSVRTGSSSTITFDYLGWGEARLTAYFSHKANLLGSSKKVTIDTTLPYRIDNTLIQTNS